MSLRTLGACLAISFGAIACTVASPEPSSERTATSSDSAASTTSSLTLPDPLAADCPGSIECAPEFNNCQPLGDIDCGDEFCRFTNQCSGDGTFIRVSHVSICFNDAGASCVAIRQGRRLEFCGC
jgi:hypothetical protein